jgi:acyl-CoA synthetase (AMP-forming)/AMP-acid ligase II
MSVLDTVGHPLPGVSITFHAEDGLPDLPQRVHIRSGGVASGYVGEPDGDFRDGGFLTGDFGHFDEDGRLRLTGRVSSFINVAGKKVQPAEVEEALREMPGVRDVRVVAAADPQRGEQVAACIAAERTAPPITALTVRKFCSARLAPYKIPRVVVVLDALPLTARGKIDRRALDDAVRAAIAGFPEQLC